MKEIFCNFNHMADMGPFNYYSNLPGNIFLFMPLPFILIFLFKLRRFSSILLTGFLLSRQ
jgi:hypothetical protein